MLIPELGLEFSPPSRPINKKDQEFYGLALVGALGAEETTTYKVNTLVRWNR